MKALLFYLCFSILSYTYSQTCYAFYAFSANYETVHFFNQSTSSNIHYYWNFGDGTGSNVKEPVHKFQENGNYLVTLYVHDTLSNCSNYYEQWLSVTKFSASSCVPSISDSIYYYNYVGTPAYYLKIIDNSVYCNNYNPSYYVGYASGPYNNTFGLGLYPGNFISTAYFSDNNNTLVRAAVKTSPNNFNRAKNYGPCSANFEFKVISEDNLGQRILFTAMNKNASSYRWIITGFGVPILSFNDTVSVYHFGNPNSVFPNLAKNMVLVIEESNGCRDSLLQQIVVRKKAATFVGIEDNNLPQISVSFFPNPVIDKVRLDFDKNYERLDKLFIYTNLGQTVFLMDSPSAKQEINLSFLNQGIYFLSVSGKSGTKVFKIIKE